MSDELASINQRAAARLIDWILLIGVWMMMLVASGSIVDDPENLSSWVVLSWMVAFAVYETLLVATLGYTAGKWVMNIRVASLATGQNPPLVQAFLRVAPVLTVVALGAVLASVPLGEMLFPLLLVLLYYTAGFASDSYRGILDRVAGTVVVRA